MKKQHEWQLQEAKNKLSNLVHEAMSDGPQIITLRGKKAVVVLSIQEYHKLTHKRSGSLSEFFRASPLMGSDIDLSRDKETSRDIEDL